MGRGDLGVLDRLAEGLPGCEDEGGDQKLSAKTDEMISRRGTRTYDIPPLLPDLGQNSTLPHDPPNTHTLAKLTLAVLPERVVEDQLVSQLVDRVNDSPDEVLNVLYGVVTRQEVEDRVKGEEVTSAGQVVQVGRGRVGHKRLIGQRRHCPELRRVERVES